LSQLPKQCATALLDLIDGKGQKHQQRQNGRQALSAVAVVVLESVCS
jgi:hypothetical protein